MLIIIKSPLQIICAFEYLNTQQVPMSEVSFIYLRKYSLSDVQVHHTFTFYGVSDYSTVKFGNSNIFTILGFSVLSSKFFLFKMAAKLGQLITDVFAKRSFFQLVKNETRQTLVLGDPNFKLYERLPGLIANKNIVLLDDGLSSMVIKPDYRRNNNKVISFSFLRQQSDYADECIVHSFPVIKSLSKLSISKDLILFIGQPLYEANFVSIGEMENLFQAIADIYPGKRFIYIAHRWERHIESFKFPANFEVHTRQYLPLELFISQFDPIPHHVVSFYSSALITLKKILPNELVFSAFDIQELIKMENIQKGYEMIKSFGIPVVKFIK